jgi:hypothetical protein
MQGLSEWSTDGGAKQSYVRLFTFHATTIAAQSQLKTVGTSPVLDENFSRRLSERDLADPGGGRLPFGFLLKCVHG